jgi:hypothetical protein
VILEIFSWHKWERSHTNALSGYNFPFPFVFYYKTHSSFFPPPHMCALYGSTKSTNYSFLVTAALFLIVGSFSQLGYSITSGNVLSINQMVNSCYDKLIFPKSNLIYIYIYISLLVKCDVLVFDWSYVLMLTKSPKSDYVRHFSANANHLTKVR